MLISQTLYCLMLGLTIGLVYGLSFDTHQRRVLRSGTHTSTLIKHLLLLMVMRLALIIPCFYYLLRLPQIHSILVLITFIAAFWLVLFYKKAQVHDKH